MRCTAATGGAAWPERGNDRCKTQAPVGRLAGVSAMTCHTVQEGRSQGDLMVGHTFRKVFEQWFAFRKLSLKPGRQSTQEQIQRIFNKDLLPALGARSVFEIKRPDLLEALEKIERRRAFTTAEKCRTWPHRMYRYALVKVPGFEQNPVADLDVVAASKPPVTHNPFLRVGEISELLQKLRV